MKTEHIYLILLSLIFISSCTTSNTFPEETSELQEKYNLLLIIPQGQTYDEQKIKELYVYDLKTEKLNKIATDVGSNLYLSPDKEKIVYYNKLDFNSDDVFMFNLITKQNKILNVPKAYRYDFSPDSEKIAYKQGNFKSGISIHVFDINLDKEIMSFNDIQGIRMDYVLWKDNSNLIIFTEKELFLLNINTKQTTRLDITHEEYSEIDYQIDTDYQYIPNYIYYGVKNSDFFKQYEYSFITGKSERVTKLPNKAKEFYSLMSPDRQQYTFYFDADDPITDWKELLTGPEGTSNGISFLDMTEKYRFTLLRNGGRLIEWTPDSKYLLTAGVIYDKKGNSVIKLNLNKPYKDASIIDSAWLIK